MKYKKNKLIEEVKLDFLGKIINRSIRVKFKNKISKSTVYISKKNRNGISFPFKQCCSKFRYLVKKNLFKKNRYKKN